MPRTRFDKYRAQLPEVDMLKGFILERMGLKGHKTSYEQLAEAAGMSTANLRLLMSDKHTEDWKAGQRRAVCTALGLDEERIRAAEYYYHRLPELFRTK